MSNTAIEPHGADVAPHLHDAGPTPRWEWRMFTRTPVAVKVRQFFDNGASAAQAETYIVSSASPNNVKIRDGRLEIKMLERREPGGLELWRPVLKAEFPITAGSIVEACNAWGLPSPVSIARASTIEEFLADVVRPSPLLRAVNVVKQRTRMHILACRGEHVELLIDRAYWESISLEDANPDRVHEALTHLGLDGRHNTSYPAALKYIAGPVTAGFASRTQGAR